VAQLFADEALAGAALEEEFAGLRVFRQEVGLVVDELERATVACRSGSAGVVVGEALAKIRRVASVELAVFEAAEDIDVVHVLVSDGWRGGCQLLGGP